MDQLDIVDKNEYLKYEKKKEKVNDKNRYQLRHMERQEDGTPICPAGHVFEIERVGLNIKGVYPKTTIYYRNKNCEECGQRRGSICGYQTGL